MEYLFQSCVSGLWHRGAAFQWGVEPEFHYWHEAGFRKIDEQFGFKEGNGDDCPMEFYANMAVLGLSAGAAFYGLEPSIHVWSRPGETTHPFQMIPQSRRYYWIPAVSRHRRKDGSARFQRVVTGKSLAGPGRAAALFNRYYPELGTGSAWRVKVGDLIFVMHSHENRDDVQDFSVDLGGRFTGISGRLEVNSFIIIKKTGDGGMWLYTCGRREREVSLSIGVKGTGQADLELSLPEACTSKEWNPSGMCLDVRINHAHGAVSGDIRMR